MQSPSARRSHPRHAVRQEVAVAEDDRGALVAVTDASRGVRVEAGGVDGAAHGHRALEHEVRDVEVAERMREMSASSLCPSLAASSAGAAQAPRASAMQAPRTSAMQTPRASAMQTPRAAHEHAGFGAAPVPSARPSTSCTNLAYSAYVGNARTPRLGRLGSSARAALLLSFLCLAACRRPAPSGQAVAERADAGPAHAVLPAGDAPAPPPPPPPAPPRVERIRVPGDLVASLVRASSGAAPTTVFLPGICSSSLGYLMAFPEAARRQGGVVAIDGDQPCGNLEGYRSFSWDAAKLHARIEAAAAAAGLTTVPREGLTLVGYSQGAALAEQLVQRFPGRYARVVLIAPPTAPAAARFVDARAVVTMSCSRDVPWKMKEATSRFLKAGIPSTYLEMPGCTHGGMTEAEATFDAAFDWLRANARPTKADATAQPIVGDG